MFLCKSERNWWLSYCGGCNIYMCKKCEKLHSELFPNHKQIKLVKGKDIFELFTGFCKVKNHRVELEYFCKKHNELCCAKCIAKLKGKERGTIFRLWCMFYRRYRKWKKK